MRIIEIFSSIQGEGPDAGLPTVFVRTARCNLRCVWCDSEYTFSKGEEISLEKVLEKTLSYQLPAVCLTGGEPMLSKEIPFLAHTLVKRGLAVSIFTNGTKPLDILPKQVRKVVDLKPPSSLVESAPNLSYLSALDSKDVVKFVLREENDYRFAIKISKDAGILEEGAPKGASEGTLERALQLKRSKNRPMLWLAPAFGDLEPSDLVSWILRDRVEARLNLQLHKFIWDPSQIGV